MLRIAHQTAAACLLGAAYLIVVPALAAQALPTKVLVRAAARDAKVIGSNVGGARIVVRDVATGAVLAEGVQEGSTGVTDLLVTERPRHGAYAANGSAGYVAELELERPTLVDITATGPLAAGGSETSATKRMLLLPGVDVMGDGVVLEINGLTVDLEQPASTDLRTGASIHVRATVRMLCGCPTEPGGLWDAEDMRIWARLLARGRVLAERELTYTGESSTYAGSIQAPEPGTYRLEVLAAQPSAANFGRAVLEVEVVAR